MFSEEIWSNNHPVHLVRSHDKQLAAAVTEEIQVHDGLVVHGTILVWMTHYNTVKFLITRTKCNAELLFGFGNKLQCFLSTTGSLVDESKDPNTIYVHNMTMSLLQIMNSGDVYLMNCRIIWTERIANPCTGTRLVFNIWLSIMCDYIKRVFGWFTYG